MKKRMTTTQQLLVGLLRMLNMAGTVGGIYVKGGSTAQTGIDLTPVKMSGFVANSAAVGCTPDHTDDSITLTIPGYYLAFLSISYSGTLNVTWDVEVALDGAASGYVFQRKLGAGGDVGNAGCIALVNAAVGGEKVSVLINSDAGGGASFTPVHAQLFALKVA